MGNLGIGMQGIVYFWKHFQLQEELKGYQGYLNDFNRL